MLEQRGSNLSLGQRQLLSFARALVAAVPVSLRSAGDGERVGGVGGRGGAGGREQGRQAERGEGSGEGHGVSVSQ